MKFHHALQFLVGGSFSLSLLLHGVPPVLAFAQQPTSRFLNPRSRQASTSTTSSTSTTTVMKQSSRSLFSRSQPLPKDDKQFLDVREARKEQQQREARGDKDHWWNNQNSNNNNDSQPTMPMESNIHLLQRPVAASRTLLDRSSIVSVTATGLLAALSLYALIQSGRLAAMFRHTNVVMEYIFQSYKSSLVNNPLSTKVGTGAVLAVLGDAMAQSLTSSNKKNDGSGAAQYDKRRALSFAAFDACYRVFQHHMFPAVIALCQGNALARLGIVPSIGAAMERTMVYQLLVVPLIYYPVFFAFTGFIQGLNIQQNLERFRTSYFRCWRRNLIFWIPTQMVLFGAINEHFQIPFACVMGVLWSMILSLTAGKTK